MQKQALTLLFLIVCLQCRLAQVASVFRHGARYPLHDLYDANATKQLWGQLTAVGMREHQRLGEMLRKEYIDDLGFLSSTYQQEEIYVVTTNVNRTYQSVLSQMYGLYPLGDGPKLPKVDSSYHLPPYSRSDDASDQVYSLPQGHTPIPVYQNGTVTMLSCPRSAEEMAKNQNEKIEVYRQMNETYYPFMEKMGKIFSFKTLNFTQMVYLYDTLTVDKFLGRALPDEFSDDDYENLQHLTNWYSLFRLTNNISKAFNSPVLARIMEDFNNRVHPTFGPRAQKWTFFSLHDTNLFCLLNDLNISSANCTQQKYSKGSTSALNCEPGPQFAASLIFQLHTFDEKEYEVRIKYNGKYVKMCERDSVACEFWDFRERVFGNIFTNHAHQICFGTEDVQEIVGQQEGGGYMNDVVQLQ